MCVYTFLLASSQIAAAACCSLSLSRTDLDAFLFDLRVDAWLWWTAVFSLAVTCVPNAHVGLEFGPNLAVTLSGLCISCRTQKTNASAPAFDGGSMLF